MKRIKTVVTALIRAFLNPCCGCKYEGVCTASMYEQTGCYQPEDKE